MVAVNFSIYIVTTDSSFSEGRKTFKPADFYGAKELKGVFMLSGENSVYARFKLQIPSKISFAAFFEKRISARREAQRATLALWKPSPRSGHMTAGS